MPQDEIAALADPDARENWQIVVAFRNRLTAAGTVEAAYLDLVGTGPACTPPLFLSHLVHLILRNALDGCDDPYVLRAAELFFRPQRVGFAEGAVLLADAEIVEVSEAGRHAAPLAALLSGDPIAELDVLSTDNAWTYWSRSDAFDGVEHWRGPARPRSAGAGDFDMAETPCRD